MQHISDSTTALTSGKARLWAILVGVNSYQDTQLPVLQYSAADCSALAEVLLAATQQFPKRRIISHHDFATQMPTQEAILASFSKVISKAKPQDTVLFYFSGHGLVEPESQRAVLCLNTTQSNRLLETGLPMHEVLQQLDRCESRQQLIWLDACHSGELMIQGAKGAEIADEPTTTLLRLLRQQAVRNKGLYALLSCDQGQRSWEFPELGHGLFTYYLIQGLRGEAADAAGIISADGLYHYLYYHIIDFIRQKNQAVHRLNEHRRRQGESLMHPEYTLQTPKRIVDGVGDLVVGLKAKAATSPNSSPESSSIGIGPLPQAQPTSEADPALVRSRIGPIRWRRASLWLGAALLGLGIGILHTAWRSLAPSAPSSQAATTSCNLQLKLTEPLPNRSLEPQITLNNCEARLPWQPTQVQPLFEGNPVWAVAFGATDSLLASAGDKGGEIWDLNKKQQTYILGGHTDKIYGLAIDSNAAQVATASADETVRLWDVATRTLRYILKGHVGPVWSVSISPNGDTIATASGDNTVKLWDVKTGTLRRTLTRHQNRVFAVAFSPNGELLASASEDKMIQLWNSRTGDRLRSLAGHTDAVRGIAFSSDGTKLASASWDRTVKLWDTKTGQLLHSFSGHGDNVVAVAFSPDGKTLASSSIDNTIKLWSLANNTLLATLHGHTDWVLSVAFSPDGQTLASGSRDQTILLWQK
jgi:uncharacterized caspase-like protein